MVWILIAAYSAGAEACVFHTYFRSLTGHRGFRETLAEVGGESTRELASLFEIGPVEFTIVATAA